jgi:hypothetical protein
VFRICRLFALRTIDFTNSFLVYQDTLHTAILLKTRRGTARGNLFKQSVPLGKARHTSATFCIRCHEHARRGSNQYRSTMYSRRQDLAVGGNTCIHGYKTTSQNRRLQHLLKSIVAPHNDDALHIASSLLLLSNLAVPTEKLCEGY